MFFSYGTVGDSSTTVSVLAFATFGDPNSIVSDSVTYPKVAKASTVTVVPFSPTVSYKNITDINEFKGSLRLAM
jgi:hypothetical protein